MTHVHVVQCQFGSGQSASPFTMFFECGMAHADLAAALLRDGLVHGARLRGTVDAKGVFIANSREPFTLGIAGLANIQPPRRPIRVSA